MTQLMMGGAGDTACRQGCSSQDTMVQQSRTRVHLQDGLHRDSAGSCGRLPCCAVLRCAVPCHAASCRVVLRRAAVLCRAVMCCAVLRYAVLQCCAGLLT